MKNLFKKYLQKHRIQFKLASGFKEFLKAFRTKNFKACFIDIDVNVKTDDLEKLVNLMTKFNEPDTPSSSNNKYKIYCLYSRDIEKAKTRFLQRNNIQCVKKPI
jgi:hypothetical protein